ncbi:NF038130 family PEP-CTERM protein [Planktothrix mougeotii]|uniref:NF038130 family PEP-CTERM protein n=1 Tax=Planktothrix mougeotii LEGE 06226 TaxID=1828728 RepID=A0ABR9UBW6_9CYAN|nr:NF038130 family PEP-CTERM protein [Planktothrix mougeotii]MBE9143922.1 NF038130 family PEP-CTERM protein [Planktothrix mougeotii LEGE 06226]
MAALLKKLLIGTSVAVGMSAVGIAPAFAGSLTGVNVSGQHLTYGYNGSQTYKVDNNAANWAAALEAGAGNIELAGQTGSPNTFGFGTPDGWGGYENQQASTLTGFMGGKKYTFSSLTYDDWYYTYDENGNSLADTWFTDAWNNEGSGLEAYVKKTLTAYKFDVDEIDVETALFGLRALGKDVDLFSRVSNANIDYVNDDNGMLNLGLVGHWDHISGLKFSEVLKVTIGEGDNALTKFLYKTGQADEQTGYTEKTDNVSHSGLYRFGLAIPNDVASVPEPSAMFGLIALGGLFAASKRKNHS